METEVIKTKICTKCDVRKPIDNFSDRKTAKDGKRSQCKLCIQSGKKGLNICGIYKITSPTGRVYIGQSRDIKNRWSSYRTRECPSQYKLNNSFIKYGVKNHVFEIIEECEAESLNKLERYWQDFYDVLNDGLNCTLTGAETPSYKTRADIKKIKTLIPNGIIDIIDVETGIFLYNVKEASNHCGVPKSHLRDMLIGKAKNKSSLIRSDDYEEGYLPCTLFTPEEGRTRVKIKEGLEVINYETGEILGDTSRASKLIGIGETTLRSYLNGIANNKTNLIYKKDFDKGLKPNELCNNIIQKKRCINYITEEIFESITEASKSLGVDCATLSKYLKNKFIDKNYPIKLL